MRGRAAAAVVALVVVAALTGSPGAGASSATVRYVLPLGVDAVVGTSPPVGADLCDVACLFGPEPNMVGNPIYAFSGPATGLTVQLFDDHWAPADTAAGVCLSAVHNGRCDPGDLWLVIRCGPFLVPQTIGNTEIVVVAFTYVDSSFGECGATKGFATISWS